MAYDASVRDLKMQLAVLKENLDHVVELQEKANPNLQKTFAMLEVGTHAPLRTYAPQ